MEAATKVEIIKLYNENARSLSIALRKYKALHKLSIDSFAVSTITRLIFKFKQPGSVHDLPRSDRPSLANDRKEIGKNVL